MRAMIRLCVAFYVLNRCVCNVSSKHTFGFNAMKLVLSLLSHCTLGLICFKVLLNFVCVLPQSEQLIHRWIQETFLCGGI